MSPSSVVPTDFGPIDRASLCLCRCCQETETSSMCGVQLSRFHLKTEIESSLGNVMS
jgi:hypothetical protein